MMSQPGFCGMLLMENEVQPLIRCLSRPFDLSVSLNPDKQQFWSKWVIFVTFCFFLYNLHLGEQHYTKQIKQENQSAKFGLRCLWPICGFWKSLYFPLMRFFSLWCLSRVPSSKSRGWYSARLWSEAPLCAQRTWAQTYFQACSSPLETLQRFSCSCMLLWVTERLRGHDPILLSSFLPVLSAGSASAPWEIILASDHFTFWQLTVLLSQCSIFELHGFYHPPHVDVCGSLKHRNALDWSASCGLWIQSLWRHLAWGSWWRFTSHLVGGPRLLTSM